MAHATLGFVLPSRLKRGSCNHQWLAEKGIGLHISHNPTHEVIISSVALLVGVEERQFLLDFPNRREEG